MYIVTPKLGKILRERNMTQKDLSDITGISQPVISRFDRNGQHLDLHLVMISRALNLKIDDLFEIDEQLEILDMVEQRGTQHSPQKQQNLRVADDKQPYEIDNNSSDSNKDQ